MLESTMQNMMVKSRSTMTTAKKVLGRKIRRKNTTTKSKMKESTAARARMTLARKRK